VQESLSNAVRHGNPALIKIDVDVNSDGSIGIRVVDDGGGLKSGASGGGFGIVGMQERVMGLGGTLEVANRDDGRGVVVSARLPARGKAVAARDRGRQEIRLQ
jgi:signal transduction histidine kinase